MQDEQSDPDSLRLLLEIRALVDPARRIRPQPFNVAAREYEREHLPTLRDSYTMRFQVRHLAGIFGDRPFHTIDVPMVRAFIADKLTAGLRPSTANRYRSILGRMFVWAIEKGYAFENPVPRVKKLRESEGRIRYLTTVEIDRLLEACNGHLRPVVLFALHTGGRRREILTLRWRDVDLAQRVVVFDQTNTKSAKRREVPMSDTLHAEAARMREAARGNGRDVRDELIFSWQGEEIFSIKTAFETARKRAGLGKDVVFHVLRHSFASHFMMNGGQLYVLQQYLGHSTPLMTQRYAHLSREFLRAGVQFIGPRRAAEGGE